MDNDSTLSIHTKMGELKDYKEDERTENLFTPDNNFDFLKHFMNIFLKNHSTEP